MNARRIAFAFLMVTVFLVPFLMGIAAAAISVACHIGWQACNAFFEWLVCPKEKP
jgi:hypothetical protein